jgi:hypothetical protein
MEQPKRRVSPLVNALWGSGIKFQTLPESVLRQLRWALVGFTVLAATGIGVFIGLVAGPTDGAIAAAITGVLVGWVNRATFRDYT